MELVHIISKSPSHVTEMLVKTEESRRMHDALACQVGPEPVVNQVRSRKYMNDENLVTVDYSANIFQSFFKHAVDAFVDLLR